MALIVSTWLWGTKYGKADVAKLQAGVARNLKQPHEFRVFTPLPEDEHLTKIPGCFARLRGFDPEWQKAQGLTEADRVLTLDLDLVVVRPFDDLVDREEPFSILTGINGTNPCPYNGSVWMFRPGYRPDVWSDFSVGNYKRLGVPFHAFPDDQGWFYYKMPNAGAYGPHNGVYGFHKKGWAGSDRLPENAKIVAFPGWRSPDQFPNVHWIQRHWRA